MDVASLTEKRFAGEIPELPLSFLYGGKRSSVALRRFALRVESECLDRGRERMTLTYTDSETGLVMRCIVTRFEGYPAAEWIVFFSNAGDSDTEIISDVNALDLSLACGRDGEFLLRHALGSDCKIDDFLLLEDRLESGGRLEIGSVETSSIGALPFFTMQYGGGGLVAAVGWSGSWKATFERDSEDGVRVNAGMESTHLLLHPGEEIRTPRMLVMGFDGDWIDGQNRWRRLLLDHYLPHPGGKALVGPLTDGNWGAATEAEQIAKIKWWVDNKLPLECYWMDAGWSGKTGPIDSWPINAADRTPNPEYYPNGLKPVSDAAHEAGMGFLLWTWPNRALPDVGVGKAHPEWLVGEAVDHGNPEANQWIIDEHVRLIEESGIDIYRQDGNPVFPPDSGPDRVGMNQIRHFEGFYRFWDTLLERFPNLVIDNCSGGGRKQDLETISRSISLWRSDYQVPADFDPIGMQCQTYGLSFWVPWSGTCSSKTTAYAMRSGFGPALCINWHVYESRIDSTGFDFDGARRLVEEFLGTREYFFGDYYPLTGCDVDPGSWIAWQFDRADLRSGIVQAFRRPTSEETSRTLFLRGLDTGRRYRITDVDGGRVEERSGEDLMTAGLTVTLPEKPGAALLRYEKVG